MQIKRKSEPEFIALMASLMSLVALSIDALLPALKDIGLTVGITNTQDNQLLITFIFLGLGLGQLVSGPLSDSFGRKPIIYFGFGLFVFASFLCTHTTSLEIMLLGRVLQGIGLSAPRTISIAMVRDRFSGNQMARIMSFVVVVFIMVPVVAPALGKLMLEMYGWKFIFNSQLFYGAFIMIWFWRRQPETLPIENRRSFRLSLFVDGFKEFAKYRQAVVFTVISGFIVGSFMVYLSTAQQIFEVQYNLREEFPFIFALLAISVGFATFLNGTLVVKLGTKLLVKLFVVLFTLLPVLYLVLFYGKPNPDIVTVLIFFGLQFFAIGFLFGNIIALAMQPIGHIAGIGSALNGFISTIMAVPIATYIGTFITDSVTPLFVGFLICGVLSLLSLLTIKKINVD